MAKESQIELMDDQLFTDPADVDVNDQLFIEPDGINKIIPDTLADIQRRNQAIADVNELFELRVATPKMEYFNPDSSRQYTGFWDEFEKAGARGLANVMSGMTDLYAEMLPHMPTPLGMTPTIEQLENIRAAQVQTAEKLDVKAQFLWEIAQDPALQASEGGGTRGFFANAIGGTWPYMGASLTATLLTGSPMGAFAVGFGVEGNSQYRETMSKMPPGLSLDEQAQWEETAQVERLVVGTINGALEQLQARQILQLTKAGRKTLIKAATNKTMARIRSNKAADVTLSLVKNSIQEGLEEAAQEATGISARVLHGEWTPLSEAGPQIAEAAVGGAVVGPFFGGAGMLVSSNQAKSESNYVSNPKTPEEFLQNQQIVEMENSLNDLISTDQRMEFESELKNEIQEAYGAGDFESLSLIYNKLDPKSQTAQDVSKLIAMGDMRAEEIAELDPDERAFVNELNEALGRVDGVDVKPTVIPETKIMLDKGFGTIEIKDLPPVKEGNIRLYRGESTVLREGAGTFYTPFEQHAFEYAKDRKQEYGEPVQLTYIDVPHDIANKYASTHINEEYLGLENVALEYVFPQLAQHVDLQTVHQMVNSSQGKALFDKLLENPTEAMKTIQAEPKVSEDQAADIKTNARNRGLGSGNLQALIKEQTKGSKQFIQDLTMNEARDVLKTLDEYEDVAVNEHEAIVKANEPIVDSGLDARALTRVAKKAKSTEAFNRTMNLNAQLGGAPRNESVNDLEGRKKIWEENLVRSAQIAQKQVKKGGESILNPYQTMEYMLDRTEAKAGIPLRRKWLDIVAESVKYSWINERLISDAVKKSGVHKLGIMTNKESSMKIARWLDADNNAAKAAKKKVKEAKLKWDELTEEQQSSITAVELDRLNQARHDMWTEMKPKEQALAVELEKILQTQGAVYTRWARFVKWDYYAKKSEAHLANIRAKGKVPTKAQVAKAEGIVKNAIPANAPADALYKGRAAKERGELLEWLGGEKWGTVERYFMRESPNVNLLDEFQEGSIPQEIFETEIAEPGSLPLNAPSATEARTGQGEIKDVQNVSLAVLHHLDKLTSFAATYDNRAEFWDSFTSGKPSKSDLGLMRRNMNAVRGIYPFKQPLERHINIASKNFWRGYLVLNASGSMWFAARQALQNPAFAASQFNMKELAKTGAMFKEFSSVSQWMKNNKEAGERFTDYYAKSVSQRRSVWRHYIAMSPEVSGLLEKSGIKGKAATAIDALGFVPAITDAMNRGIVWPFAYDIAERNVNQFADGKIDTQKLWDRLSLNNVTPSQQLEFQKFLDEGKFTEFKSKYAEYKTRNVHFPYHPMLRGPQEFAGSGAIFMRLMNFNRGVVNIAVKNGLEPMWRGDVRTRAGRHQVYDGFKSLVKLYAGTSIADGLSVGLTGYGAYSLGAMLIGVGGGTDPGAEKILNLIGNVKNVMFRYAQGEYGFMKAAEQMVKAVGNEMEIFVPFSELAVDAYENANDVEGVRLYTLVRSKLDDNYLKEHGIKFNKRSRTSSEKMKHLIFGRERKEKKTTLQDALRQSTADKVKKFLRN